MPPTHSTWIAMAPLLLLRFRLPRCYPPRFHRHRPLRLLRLLLLRSLPSSPPLESRKIALGAGGRPDVAMEKGAAAAGGDDPRGGGGGLGTRGRGRGGTGGCYGICTAVAVDGRVGGRRRERRPVDHVDSGGGGRWPLVRRENEEGITGSVDCE